MAVGPRKRKIAATKRAIEPRPNVANCGDSLALARKEKVNTARPTTPNTFGFAEPTASDTLPTLTIHRTRAVSFTQAMSGRTTRLGLGRPSWCGQPGARGDQPVKIHTGVDAQPHQQPPDPRWPDSR